MPEHAFQALVLQKAATERRLGDLEFGVEALRAYQSHEPFFKPRLHVLHQPKVTGISESSVTVQDSREGLALQKKWEDRPELSMERSFSSTFVA